MSAANPVVARRSAILFVFALLAMILPIAAANYATTALRRAFTELYGNLRRVW